MNQRIIQKIFTQFQQWDPHPTTELIYHSHFELMIAVILSARATDKSVNKATINLFKIASTPQQILSLGEEKLAEYIKNIGLYKSKARHIMATCQLLITRFNGHIPNRRDDLESLPGIGRKSANVILNTCFGEPEIAVDTHILRVSNRIGLASGRTPFSVEKQLMACIPNQFKKNAHHWLVLHGRYVCIARKPRCSTCLIKDWCEYPHKIET